MNTIPQDALYSAHIGIGVLTAAAVALLGLMFWNSSLTNRDRFTACFLKFLSGMAVVRAVEIGTAMYRASQIDPQYVPVDAAVVALSGRTLELTWYCVTIWFMLR